MVVKRKRVSVDVTDPNRVFVHKGGKRRNRVYVVFNVETRKDVMFGKGVIV